MVATAAVLTSLVARADELTPAPGVTGTVGLVVTGGPDGEVTAWLRLEEGRPVEAGAPDGNPPADLTFTVGCDEARAMVSGALDPSVAFMRGRLKTAGDNGLLLGVLAATADPGFTPWIAGVVGVASDGASADSASVDGASADSASVDAASAVDAGGPA